MLDWLYNTVYTLYGRLPGSVKDLINSALRGILGALNAVAGNMWTVWWDMVAMAQSLPGIVKWAFNGIYHALDWLLNVEIAHIWNLLQPLWLQVQKLTKKVVELIAQAIADVTAKVWRWVQDTITWVNQHVWLPLWGWVQDLYDKMTRWAYTAWFYVTHPDALAEVLFWSLWGVFTRNALTVSRSIGEWALRMVLQNAVTGVKLVEQIITDVL